MQYFISLLSDVQSEIEKVESTEGVTGQKDYGHGIAVGLASGRVFTLKQMRGTLIQTIKEMAE